MKPTSIQNVWELPDGSFAFTYADDTNQSRDQVYKSFEDAVNAQNVYKWYVVEILGDRLKHEELTISFKKSDGTLRTMRCTAKTSAFPNREATERIKASNPDIQVVWDLDKQAVRSFRKDSIVDVIN